MMHESDDMTQQNSNNYSLFTGCLVPSKFPFIEAASRKVLGSFGISLHSIEGASCCPNQMAIQSSNKTLWYALAARNLALAEKDGYDIVSLCNGCYDTLKTVNTRLKGDDGFRDEVNRVLEDKFGLRFQGTIDVKHLVQVLHEDIGFNALERASANPLGTLKCAPFGGCHSKRPGDHMGFDDPDDPHFLGDLISAIGGDVVSYAEENSCCGGGLSIGRKDDVVPAARRVLLSAQKAGAEVVVVNCPFCFAQLARSQEAINDIFLDGLHVPIFYITQLIGLAIGLGPKELGMPMHYECSVGGEEGIVARLLGKEAIRSEEIFTDEVTPEQLEICAKCMACTDDCSTAATTSEYHPEEILRLVIDGKVEEALERDDIWFCMNCHECVENCPQRFGMVKLLVRLKNLAVARGNYPDVIGHRISGLHDSGFSFAPNLECREEMGLPDVKSPDMVKLKKLLEEDSENKGD
jgi:heterodisulfide reductase subunit B